MTFNFTAETEPGLGDKSKQTAMFKTKFKSLYKFYLLKNKNKNEKVTICTAKLTNIKKIHIKKINQIRRDI